LRFRDRSVASFFRVGSDKGAGAVPEQQTKLKATRNVTFGAQYPNNDSQSPENVSFSVAIKNLI
jgi:hypothetical protein